MEQISEGFASGDPLNLRKQEVPAGKKTFLVGPVLSGHQMEG